MSRLREFESSLQSFQSSYSAQRSPSWMTDSVDVQQKMTAFTPAKNRISNAFAIDPDPVFSKPTQYDFASRSASLMSQPSSSGVASSQDLAGLAKQFAFKILDLFKEEENTTKSVPNPDSLQRFGRALQGEARSSTTKSVEDEIRDELQRLEESAKLDQKIAASNVEEALAEKRLANPENSADRADAQVDDKIADQTEATARMQKAALLQKKSKGASR